MKKITLVLLGVLFVGEANAYPTYGPSECQYWLDAENKTEKDSLELKALSLRSWVSGFISGMNVALGVDVVNGADVSTTYDYVIYYCSQHREATSYDAIADMVDKLSGK